MNAAVPFNVPKLSGHEFEYLREAYELGQLAGNGKFTERCSDWISSHLGAPRALLTHSCTGALEMAAILSGVEEGDEVIMPSYTFVSTANAFVLRGAVPVFIDINPETLCIDENLIEAAISSRTRAIVVVHYAGFSPDMDKISEIARGRGLFLVEDAAQALMSSFRGKELGSFGDVSCFSFHETKNIISGEGGALVINDPNLISRAEIIWEKGTNRSAFFRGAVDKYSWVDVGSSFLPGELTAAFLLAQLENAQKITSQRLEIWREYQRSLSAVSRKVDLPKTSEDIRHNGHLFFLLLPDLETRSAFIAGMRDRGISCPFHYVPLHASEFGRRAAKVSGSLPVTTSVADRLVRLPIWLGIEEHQPYVIESGIAEIDKLGLGVGR